VKICGVTRPADAEAAAALGADAVGVNLWPGSRRHVPPARAREIVRALPPWVTAVGVLVNPTREELLRAIEASGVAAIQLHGDEPPAACLGLPVPVVKALRVRDAAALDALAAYDVQGFLLDAPTPGYGGSGETFDWAVAAEAVRRGARVILAGGLGPDNVAAAVRAVRPWGVDVASGVESAPGVKDLEKVAAFVRAAKERA
jgi:phosphoribosylanthranilate isomerase